MKSTRRHGSSPYSLLFARQPNYFEDYSSENLDPVKEQLLLDRITYMSNIVYPAIQDKTSSTMQSYREQFIKKNLVINNKFTPGSLVMAKTSYEDLKMKNDLLAHTK
jgi:hypothetical protein